MAEANLAQSEERVLAATEERQEEIIDLACRLIRTPTENMPPGGQEGAGQQVLHQFLTDSGIKAQFLDLDKVEGLTQHEAYLPGRDYSGRPNLIARLPGRGGGRSLLLSGHMDTMPVGTNPWQHEPLGAQIEQGRIYGRGAWDMKGALAAMAMSLAVLDDSGTRLGGDLLFESVVDEEHAGCNGTLASRLAGHNAEGVIIGEPSSFRLFPAHRGFRIAHISLKGTAAMSLSGEEIANPVEDIGRLIEGMKEFRRLRRQTAPIGPLYADYPDPVPVWLPKLQAGEFTLHVPMQIPEECKLEVYWQTMPGETRESVERQFLDFLDELCQREPALDRDSVEVQWHQRWMPGTQIPPDHPLVTTLRECAAQVLEEAVAVVGGPFPCDLFIFNLYANTPGLILGPRGENAHAADEFVYAADLVTLVKIYCLMAMRWCGVE